MDDISVYEGLLLVFPQIDTRILKAVSIENPKDVFKAIDVVLTEVIPNIASTSGSADDDGDGNQVCNSDVSPVKSNIVAEPNQNNYVASTIWDSDDEPSNIQCVVESNFDQSHSNVDSLNVKVSSEDVSPVAVLDCTPAVSVVDLPQAHDEVERDSEIPSVAPVNSITITEVVDCENEPMDDKTDHGRAEFEDEHLNTEVSNSAQICRIDLLEDIITDARDNKKTLFMAVESVISLMREVEVREKEAEEVKEEAARGPVAILASVEDLKQMLKHAREANDMHAGEVYGEKAILATEAKELQSRLFCLSDERDKSLAILNEMRLTLQQRLDAAEEAVKLAEQEKMEKEESARIALAEQEQIMEKLVQESKMLKQEAEENSKLQDFLMDRGRVVDTLQGEISVIFQDINLLKQKFDNRVPLSDSISSSQTSCRLASSSSSMKSLALNQVAKRTSPTSSISDHLSSGEEIEANDRTALVEDDGWEVCDEDLNM